MFEPSPPYLSIVCAFGDAQRAPAWLTQIRTFLAVTAHRAEQFALPLEIILVDRDPSGEAETAEALLGPLPRNEFATVRIVTVPGGEIVAGKVIDRERRAQNVGIRRAQGEFVLAAGVDIILGADLMRLLASRPLREGASYHAMRIETAPAYLNAPLPPPPAAEIEADCRRGAYSATLPPVQAGFDGPVAAASDVSWADMMRRAAAELNFDQTAQFIGFGLCDFLLMGRRSWFEIGGFPEWNVGDAYFDRIVLAQARYRGWPPIIFSEQCHYFSVAALRHHDVAGDIYVDTDGDLRIRIESPPIPHLNNWQSAGVLNVLHNAIPLPLEGPSAAIRVNGPDWGLAAFDLSEQSAGPSGS